MGNKSVQREGRKKPGRTLLEKRAAKRIKSEAKTTPIIPPPTR
jgi:hypothetical protein